MQILIADNQFLIREGLKSIFASCREVRVMECAGHKDQLFRDLRIIRPDILVLDHRHVEHFLPEDISMVPVVSPGTQTLVITDITDREAIMRVVQSGVAGFLTHTCDAAEILDAVQALTRGEKMFCHKVLDIVMEQHAPDRSDCAPQVLSGREIEIIRLIASGFTTREIADTLYRSFHTISTHRKNIMKKLGVKSTTELMVYAMNTGLIHPDERLPANA